MVSGLGLGKFNPLDMKEMTKSSSKASSFDTQSSKEVTPRSNNSSVSQNKSVEKNEKKSEVSKTDKNEFSQKVEKFSKGEEKVSSQSTGKIEKLDNQEIKDAQNEIQKAGPSEIPQMAMLQGVQPVFVNQQAPVSEIKPQDGAIDLNVKVSEQTQPVLKFLKAMQENFGISPQQVMKALGEMNPETMMQSPQQAMTPLFEKLGLQPKQFTKAQILFTEMIGEMEQTQPELFKGKVPAATTAGAAGLGGAMAMKSSELPVQMERPMAAPKSTLDQLIEQKISRRALEPQNMQGGAIPAQPQQAQVNMADIFKMPQQPSQMQMQPEALTIDKLQQFDPNLRIEDVKINPNKISEDFMSNSSTLGAAGGASIPVLGKELDKDMTEEQMKDQLAEQLAQQMPGAKKVDGQFAMDKLAVATAAGMPANSGQLSNETVEKMISGSQSLIQKGGGEMKIQMNPEGLGQIHLKVKVQDGQVGVQMMADTHEAKKLLETSMNDLKVGLADHKLNLNQLKVEVADQASQNLNQGQDFKREEARDFLGQFRQFNESFRQGANDLSGARAYRKAAQPATPDIQPIESRKSDSTKSGGLYLVA